MRVSDLLGNIVWWIFGGISVALEYLAVGLVLCLTIVGIPWGVQCFKLAMVMLLPFGAKVGDSHSNPLGCIGNVIWIIFAGLWIWLVHIFFGAFLFITIIGIPFARKHFAFAKLALTPFGRDIVMNVNID